MMCYVRIGTSYMGEKLQATPKKKRILVPLGGSQGIKVFRGAPPSFLCPPPHPEGPRRHLHSLCKTSDSDILDTAADCHATLIPGIV